MRSFVIGLSDYARSNDPDFIVIPQNGHELVTMNGEHDGQPAQDYLDAIDGGGQEDFNYGYDGDGVPTPDDEKAWLKGFLDILESNSKQVLVIDYAHEHRSMSHIPRMMDGIYNFRHDRPGAFRFGISRGSFEGDNENIACWRSRKIFCIFSIQRIMHQCRILAALQGWSRSSIIDRTEDGVTALSSLDDPPENQTGGGTALSSLSIGE